MTATTLNRGSTWTNADGLIIGFGKNKPAKEGKPQEMDGGMKSAAVVFTYDDMATGTVNVPVPAGSKIVSVALHVETTFLGGTSLEVGDGSDDNGFITATAAAVANLVAGATINSDGVYAYGATDTVAHEQHLYASADTIDVKVTGTFTAGKAALVVVYV